MQTLRASSTAPLGWFIFYIFRTNKTKMATEAGQKHVLVRHLSRRRRSKK